MGLKICIPAGTNDDVNTLRMSELSLIKRHGTVAKLFVCCCQATNEFHIIRAAEEHPEDTVHPNESKTQVWLWGGGELYKNTFKDTFRPRGVRPSSGHAGSPGSLMRLLPILQRNDPRCLPLAAGWRSSRLMTVDLKLFVSGTLQWNTGSTMALETTPHRQKLSQVILLQKII